MGQEYSTLCFCKRKNDPRSEQQVSVFVIPDTSSATDGVSFESEENPYHSIRDIDVYQDLSNVSHRRDAWSVGYESQDSAYSDTSPVGYVTPVSDRLYDVFPDLDVKRVRQISQRLRNPLPSSNVEFMVEAFRPQIEASVRALEIVPHITFIDDIEPYRLIARRSPREAMGLLIDEILKSAEPGKWQTFLMALETAGYRYIVELLKGEAEADHTLQKKLLRLFTPAIMKDMNPKVFVDHLLEKDVITEADKEEIRCEERNYSEIAASLMLLERVPKRVENWYEIFLEVLQTCGLGHLVECLKPDDTELYMKYPMAYPSPHVKPHESGGSSLTCLTAEKDRLEQQIQYWNEKRRLQVEVSKLQIDLLGLIEDKPNDKVPPKCPGNDLNVPIAVGEKTEDGVREIVASPVSSAKTTTTQETEILQILKDLKNEIKKDLKVDIEDLKRYIAKELVKHSSKSEDSGKTIVPVEQTAEPLGYGYYIPSPTTHKMVRSASDSGLASLSSSRFSGYVYNELV